jgi:hypothetical protein
MEQSVNQLVEICFRHVVPATIPVFLHERYIPYFPTLWNGLLVLGEVQNLSRGYGGRRSEGVGGRSRRGEAAPELGAHAKRISHRCFHIVQ